MDTNEVQPLEVAAEPAVEQALLPNDSVQPVPSRAWPSKPWLTIWTKPRGTIRAILNSDPRRFVLLLAGLSGIYGSLNNLSSRQLGESTPWYILVLIAFIVGPIGGIIGLYLGGAVFSWVGSLLKGHGDAEQQRAAIAWSFIPSMVSLVLWLPLLALYGGKWSMALVRVSRPVPSSISQ